MMRPLLMMRTRGVSGPAFAKHAGINKLTKSAGTFASIGEAEFEPVETHRDWYVVDGVESSFGLRREGSDHTYYQFADQDPEVAISYLNRTMADGTVSAEFILNQSSNTNKSFPLAMRMTSTGNAVGIRTYNSVLELYDRVDETFTKIGEYVGFTVPSKVSLSCHGSAVTVSVDGVEVIAGTTALTDGYYGILSRASTLFADLTKNFTVVEG